MALLTLTHEGHEIPIHITRRRRKTLGIRIRPTGEVEVSAPPQLDEAEVMRLVQHKADWIVAQVGQALKQPQPLRCVTGAQWPYLGQPRTLRVVQGEAEGVEERGEVLLVTAFCAERAPDILQDWFLAQARCVLPQRLAHCAAHAGRFGLTFTGRLTIRPMTSRWGSLRSTGDMTLNSHLIHAPLEGIDTVIFHELCHLREMNHSPRFYALLSEVSPHWRQQVAHLKSLEAHLRGRSF